MARPAAGQGPRPHIPPAWARCSHNAHRARPPSPTPSPHHPLTAPPPAAYPRRPHRDQPLEALQVVDQARGQDWRHCRRPPALSLVERIERLEEERKAPGRRHQGHLRRSEIRRLRRSARQLYPHPQAGALPTSKNRRPARRPSSRARDNASAGPARISPALAGEVETLKRRG